MAMTNVMLSCFAAVAESGNLADAGVRLGRTPSAISMTLKQMEDHLGARLFETDRKNRLTPLGEEVFGLQCRFDRLGCQQSYDALNQKSSQLKPA